MCDGGLAERRHRRDVDGRAVELRAPSPARRIDLAAGGLVDHAGRDHAGLFLRDEHGPVRDAAGEVSRAVDGIHDEAARAGPAAAGFLGEDPVVGAGPRQRGQDGLLGVAIRDGDG